MTQLRNLVVYSPGVYLPCPLSSDDRGMRNLQSLLQVLNLKLSDEVCKRIPNVKELGLQYCDTETETLKSSSYYCLHNLGRFSKLESLHCSFIPNGRAEWRGSGLSLKFPSSLKKLSLRGCHLDWEEITRMAGSLLCLEDLELCDESVVGSEWNLVEEALFPRLIYLAIKSCDDLVYWNAESYNFPVLEHLVIEGMSKLDELPSGIGEIPTLGFIYLGDCSEWLMISAARIVRESQEYGNEALQLELKICFGKIKLGSYKKKMEEERLLIKNLYLHCMGCQLPKCYSCCQERRKSPAMKLKKK